MFCFNITAKYRKSGTIQWRRSLSYAHCCRHIHSSAPPTPLTKKYELPTSAIINTSDMMRQGCSPISAHHRFGITSNAREASNQSIHSRFGSKGDDQAQFSCAPHANRGRSSLYNATHTTRGQNIYLLASSSGTRSRAGHAIAKSLVHAHACAASC